MVSLRVVGAFLALGVLLSAFAFGGRTERRTVLFFAASSLSDAARDIEAEFERENPNVDVQVSVGGSAALREQILDGAPADVFATANVEIMNHMVEAGAVDDEPQELTFNRLVLAIPAENPAGINSVSDLSRPGLLIGVCRPDVPCGSLTERFLVKEPTLGLAEIEKSIVTEEPDVRSLLAKVESAELDAGFVYGSDVVAANRGTSVDLVHAIRLSSGDSVRASYPIAVMERADNPDDGRRLVDFALSPEGQSILAKNGFGP